MGDNVFAVHADAVIFESDGLGIFIEADTNLQIGSALKQLRLRQRFEAKLVGSIRGVGNQLAKEDLLI